MAGRAVGVVASNPLRLAGRLDAVSARQPVAHAIADATPARGVHRNIPL
jgi:acetyl-CoA carboxylase carboxyltransferase component